MKNMRISYISSISGEQMFYANKKIDLQEPTFVPTKTRNNFLAKHRTFSWQQKLRQITDKINICGFRIKISFFFATIDVCRNKYLTSFFLAYGSVRI